MSNHKRGGDKRMGSSSTPALTLFPTDVEQLFSNPSFFHNVIIVKSALAKDVVC